MDIHQRHQAITELLQSGDEVGISAVAEQLGVSEMTIRRDLDKLAASGRVCRTRGGAVLAERLAFEFDFVARRQAKQPAKRAIAAEAAQLVKPGHRLILDTGTTTLELACLLRHHEALTVITSSLAVASELQFAQGVQTILLGGVLRRGMPDLTGLVTETVLDMFSADLAFQGADGIGPDGSLYTTDLEIAAIDRKIRSRAHQTYVLADSSKLGRTALARHGSLSEVTGLITDRGIAKSDQKRFERLGTRVIVAKP